MKIKFFIAQVLLSLALVIGINSVSAIEVVDVDSNYWAAREISQALVKGYLQLNNENQFLPEAPISRADFVTGLMRVLGSDNIQVISNNTLTDINPSTKNAQSILAAEQLQIIYGYPDKTFKPEIAASRAEAMSALGHITKGYYDNLRILERFTDYKDIPEWAINPCAKAVKNALYVNYPDRKKLRPNDKLTRAEAAVLYKQVENSIELIDTKYIAAHPEEDEEADKPIPDVLLSTETLNIYPTPIKNTVELYNTKKVIKAGNVIEGTFRSDFNYKTVQVGDIVEFTAPRDVVTQQGTFLYSAGTKFSAEVIRIKQSPWRHKNDKTLLVLDRIMMTDGYHFMMAGTPLTTHRNKVVYTNHKKPNWLKKVKNKKKEIEFLINYSYRLSPRVKYKQKAGDEIYILLTDDLIIRNRDL